MQERIVHLKQSGELLTDVAGERWTPPALIKAAKRIAEVQQHADLLGVRGLLVVSGGGNVPDGSGRGANMRAQFGEKSAVSRYADVIGRRSTADNTIMLAAALTDLNVAHALFAAPNSEFNDIELGLVPEYDLEAIQAAYRDGKVVLMAGGIGKGGRTTDAAVVEYALWQKKAYPDIPSIALKATKFNGIYDRDPAKDSSAPRYTQIAASTMLGDYERFKAVDRRCLEILHEADTSNLDVRLQVYAGGYTIAQALKDEHLGTIVFSQNVKAILEESPEPEVVEV